MSKRNLQGEALEERLRLKAEDIERQRPYKEAVAAVINRFTMELAEEEQAKRSTQSDAMQRELAEREQAIRNLTIIVKNNEELKRQREIENLIKEDELKRKEEEKLRAKQLAREELLERNRQIVLKTIEDSEDFVTQENLDEKIEELLSKEVNFNFAITPDGEKIHSTKPPGNLDGWKGPSPTAYIMGGMRPGSKEWNSVFRNHKTGFEKMDKKEKGRT